MGRVGWYEHPLIIHNLEQNRFHSKLQLVGNPDLSNIDLMILRIDSSFHPILFITVKLTCVSTVKKTMMWKQTCVLKLNKKCVHNISSPLSREVSVVISLNFNACESAFLQLYHYFGQIIFSLLRKGIPNVSFLDFWKRNEIKKKEEIYFSQYTFQVCWYWSICSFSFLKRPLLQNIAIGIAKEPKGRKRLLIIFFSIFSWFEKYS